MTCEIISNVDNVIDSRDVIERIAELEQERDAWGGTTPWADEPEAEELTALKALADEAEGRADWQHGETLIRDSYFRDYAQDLAGDCDVDSWVYTCIDWEQAARELRMDYTGVDFDGVTYWVRS